MIQTARGIKNWISVVLQLASGICLRDQTTKTQRNILKRGNKDDTPSSSTRKLERRDASSNSARARKLCAKGEDNQFGRLKATLPQDADLQFHVPEESLQELEEKGDSCRRYTSTGYRSVEDQCAVWGLFYVDDYGSRHSPGTEYTENLEIYKNSNFEDLQNLFHIIQKNVNTIGWTSPSWTRSALSNDQVIKWTKANVRVYSDSVLFLENDRSNQKQIDDWKNFNSPILTKSHLELMENRLSSSGTFSQDLRRWKSCRKPRKICKIKTLNLKH